MKRTVFLVEGQTEQIFVHRFIEQLVHGASVSITLQRYRADTILLVSQRGCPPEDSTHAIQIINMEGDDTVTSFMANNIAAFQSKGVHAVFGLRDQYNGSSAKKPIDPSALDALFNKLADGQGLDLQVTVAQKEIEAWFLSVPKFFLKYDASLTVDKVNELAGLDLESDDVERIDHPSALIRRILRTVGKDYKKREDDSHRISSELDYEALYLQKSVQILPLGRLVSQLERALP